MPHIDFDPSRLGCDTPEVNALHPAPWEIRLGPGPVLAAAIHAGHDVRPEVARWMALTEEERLREEDPLTDFWLSVADSSVRVNRSRFEVDLNVSSEQAVPTDADGSGLHVWDEPPPRPVVQASLRLHESFYQIMGAVTDQLIARWGYLLVLDLHSFSDHRPEASGPADDPDIDLGTTTLDRERFGALLRRFTESLRCCSVQGRPVNVRENQHPCGGGHFAEWLHRRHPRNACVISVGYKKIFMDEWAGTADIASLNALRAGLAVAVNAAREELLLCR
ncbi:MAG TPA: N-formylglutamate amidohydrolase [Pseudomonadales bacterium]